MKCSQILGFSMMSLFQGLLFCLPRGTGGWKGGVVKDPPANAGNVRDQGSVPGLGRSPGRGNDKPLQHSCRENPMDSGAWQATVHGVEKSWTRLKRFSTAHNTGAFVLPTTQVNRN